jgi:hypothetical protein
MMALSMSQTRSKQDHDPQEMLMVRIALPPWPRSWWFMIETAAMTPTKIEDQQMIQQRVALFYR